MKAMDHPIFSPVAGVAGLLLGLTAAAVAAQIRIPVRDPAAHDVRPAPGFQIRMLSEYAPGLAHTPGDSVVFIAEGPVSGGTVFVAGGTHANEIGGIMAALLLVERAKVEQGRLIVVPYANNSAIAYRDPGRPSAAANFTLGTPSGKRTFPIGARLTKFEDQGEPDPPDAKAPSPEYATDNVPRNLDRQYPGRAEGTLTQRIAAAITALLRRERADLAFDLHEAPPESRLAMMIVANPKNTGLAAEALLALEANGLQLKLEESSSTFRGLSHREWGDATSAKAFLFETPNPGSRRESPGDPVNDREWPLARRVGVHLETLLAIVDAYNMEASGPNRIKIVNLPSAADLLKSGLGPFLR